MVTPELARSCVNPLIVVFSFSFPSFSCTVCLISVTPSLRSYNRVTTSLCYFLPCLRNQRRMTITTSSVCMYVSRGFICFIWITNIVNTANHQHLPSEEESHESNLITANSTFNIYSIFIKGQHSFLGLFVNNIGKDSHELGNEIVLAISMASL